MSCNYTASHLIYILVCGLNHGIFIVNHNELQRFEGLLIAHGKVIALY